MLLTATLFRGDRQPLNWSDVYGDGGDMKISQRVITGLVKNVALALMPVQRAVLKVSHG